MTDSEFKFLEQLYLTAKSLKNNIASESNPDEYVRMKMEFDELDPINELINAIPQRIKDFSVKVEQIRLFLLRDSNGTVTLSDKQIITIIEKAIL